MISVTADSIVTQAGHTLHTDNGTEILGMDAESGVYFSLEGSGREIWKAAQTPVRVSEICARLCAIYSVDETTCLTQTISFIDDLVGCKFLIILEPEREHA